MSSFVETEMAKHRGALQALSRSHGATSGPVYLTGVLVGLNYALTQGAPGAPADGAELQALANELKALLDTAHPA